MHKSLRVVALAALLTLLTVAACVAQGAAGGQGGGQFAQMREKYKYTFQLMSMARHIEAINKDPKYTLKPDQAKKVLAVLQPLKTKPKLTQDQAKDVLKRLKPIFNVNQLNAMARIKDRRPGMGGGGARPGAGQAPGVGQGRPSGTPGQATRPRFDPNAMKDFNPFYTKVKADDEFAKRRVARWNQFFADLQKKANTKPAPAPAKKAPPKKK